MKRLVIGTAGHIDHGKTALIKAMTGVDCDRLKEEKERGITTELGFSHYKMGDDLLIGFVDVPGHEKFVRPMVSGAWGIDMVLLVVAADEGVMPQTREHLDICELLGLTTGIVVITKIDLVDDEMIELVTDEVRELLAGRPLENSPIMPVSAKTGENISELFGLIKDLAQKIDERSKEGIFRLPVDRIFTIKGMGSIITGTCISGSLKTGEEVEIYPLNKKAKVRNIQVYHENIDEASAGQRVALNLQGIEKETIDRGVIIARPETLPVTYRVDATLKYLNLPLKPIKNNSILRFHVASTLEEARLVLLMSDSIAPGEEQFVQFVFKKPIVVLPDDRFILRGPYAIQTIGGGKILDALPAKHSRNIQNLSDIYSTLSGGNIPKKTLYHIKKGGFEGKPVNSLPIFLGKDPAICQQAAKVLIDSKEISLIDKSLVHNEFYSRYRQMLIDTTREYLNKNPQKTCISREELRSKLPRVGPHIFKKALDEQAEAGFLEVERDRVRIKSHDTATERPDRTIDNHVIKKLALAGLRPPGISDFAQSLNVPEGYIKDVLERLAFEGRIIKIKGGMYYNREIVDELKSKVKQYLMENREMTPSEFKKVVDIPRKYLIPILEYFDEIRFTIRAGEKRLLRNQQS